MGLKQGGILEPIAQDKFRLRATMEDLGMVRDRVRECAQKAGVPEKTMSQVVLATDEAVTNVINHSYNDDGESEIEVEVMVDCYKIQLAVRDMAEHFDPTGHPDPNINEHVKAGKKRGLGIFLMRKIMDEMRHNVVNGWKNELVLIKNFSPREGKDA